MQQRRGTHWAPREQGPLNSIECRAVHIAVHRFSATVSTHSLCLEVLLHEVFIKRVAARTESDISHDWVAGIDTGEHIGLLHEDRQDSWARWLQCMVCVDHGLLCCVPVLLLPRDMREVLELELDCGRLRQTAEIHIVHVWPCLTGSKVDFSQRNSTRRVERWEEPLS